MEYDHYAEQPSGGGSMPTPSSIGTDRNPTKSNMPWPSVNPILGRAASWAEQEKQRQEQAYGVAASTAAHINPRQLLEERVRYHLEQAELLQALLRALPLQMNDYAERSLSLIVRQSTF